MKIKKQLSDFKDSLKINLDFLQLLLYDLLFYAIAIPSAIIFGKLILNQTKNIDINALNQGLLAQEAAAKAQEIAANTGSLLALFFIGLFIILIITLAAWALSRGLIYNKLLNKKLTKAFFFKFMAMNIFFGFVLAMLFIFLGNLVTVSKIFIIPFYASFFVCSYFITLTYIFFTKKVKVFEALGDSLSKGVAIFPKIWLPCLLILIMFMVLGAVNQIATRLGAQQFIYILTLALYTCWARIYFVRAVEKL
jgi:hypothetical protein